MKKLACIILILSATIFISAQLFIVPKNRHCVVAPSSENVLKLSTPHDLISYEDKKLCKDISKNLGIEYADILAIGYLADEYLASIPKEINNTGFVFENNKPVNPKEFEKLLTKVRKTEYVVLNKKTHKYHKLDCKYADEMIAYRVFEKSKLPKESIPCKACHNKSSKRIEKPILAPSLSYTTNYIKVFLTDYTTNLIPTRECSSNVCKELVHNINNAQDSIDIAIYGYEKVPAIDFALTNAIKRGVKIRLVYDIDSNNNNIYTDTKELAQKIQNSKCDIAPTNCENPRKYTNSLMHNKFYIFDNKTVMTGSANLGGHDMCSFNSNSVVELNSTEIAKIYKAEFEQMYNERFHGNKEVVQKPKNIVCGDSTVSVYFSPKDNITKNVILPMIKNAKQYIYMPVFLITDRYVANALIEAKSRGVDIKVIVDAVNAKSKASKHQMLRDSGILVKTENYAGKLHSKSMIIDDRYTIIGSMNLSFAGNYSNDENVVVIDNKNIAIFYRKFFEYLWSKINIFWQTHNVSAESIYSIGSCSDGIDNDYDGLIDKEDSGCQPKNKS